MYSVTGIIFIIIGIGGLGGNITNRIITNSKNSYNINLPNLIKNLIFITLGTLLVFKTKGIILGIKKAFSNIEIK